MARAGPVGGGPLGRDQGLGRHLAAEQPESGLPGGQAAEQLGVQQLQVQHGHQAGQAEVLVACLPGLAAGAGGLGRSNRMLTAHEKV